MLRSLTHSPLLRAAYSAYVGLFFVYLALPLLAVAVFAFNASSFPGLPWMGTTLDWFLGSADPRIGLFFDRNMLRGIGNSLVVAVGTTTLSLLVGTTSAFLFERFEFR